MLSRLALRAVAEANARPVYVLVKPVTTSSSKNAAGQVATSSEGERDLVNFPRPVRREEAAKVRLAFIPEGFFTAFYAKTGVTGPYVLTFGLLATLMSKEIFVWEEGFANAVAFLIAMKILTHNASPVLKDFLNTEIDKHEATLTAYKQTKVDDLKSSIENEEVNQNRLKAYEMIVQGKKENVALQLEAAYRDRINAVYKEVKNRLDYQLETANVKSRIEQRHMVNWITDSVKKGITPSLENAALKQCLTDLKGLAKA